MVLAKLAGCITKRLQQFSNRRVFRLKSNSRAWHSNLGQARADWVLAADETGAACCAALLSVVISEGHAFLCDAVNIWRPVAHAATAEVADVPDANVIPP